MAGRVSRLSAPQGVRPVAKSPVEALLRPASPLAFPPKRAALSAWRMSWPAPPAGVALQLLHPIARDVWMVPEPRRMPELGTMPELRRRPEARRRRLQALALTAPARQRATATAAAFAVLLPSHPVSPEQRMAPEQPRQSAARRSWPRMRRTLRHLLLRAPVPPASGEQRAALRAPVALLPSEPVSPVPQVVPKRRWTEETWRAWPRMPRRQRRSLLRTAAPALLAAAGPVGCPREVPHPARRPPRDHRAARRAQRCPSRRQVPPVRRHRSGRPRYGASTARS
jgi:hypothetical protein